MSDHDEEATAFGAVAQAYHRGRPEIPVEIARWLAGSTPQRVLELGAGTGRLTAALLTLGHDVRATDPDERMLAALAKNLPEVPAGLGSAEEIDAGDSSFDLVVCADALEWFDTERALPEIARVLHEKGRFAAVTLDPDRRIPWVKRLGRVLDGPEAAEAPDPTEAIELSSYFGFVEHTTIDFWQTINSASIGDLTLTRPAVARLEPQEREQRMRAAQELYEDYGRGMDGMQLPLRGRCVRTTVLKKPKPGPEAVAADEAVEAEPAAGDPEATNPRGEQVPPPDTSDDLLIDFR